MSLLLSGWAALAASEAAKAASKQATLASKQLISDQRAWISVELIEVERAEIREDGISLDLKISITNFGKTPAIDVSTNVDASLDSEDLPRRMRKFAKESCEDNPYIGKLLIPGHSYIREWAPFLDAKKYSNIKKYYILIIICTTYKILHDDDFHQIVRSYYLSNNGDFIDFCNTSIQDKNLKIDDWGGGFAS